MTCRSLPVLPQPKRHGNVTQALQLRTVGLPVAHSLTVMWVQVRQYALATALAKYGAMAGPGQIGPSIMTVDMLVGTGSELVSSCSVSFCSATFAQGELAAVIAADCGCRRPARCNLHRMASRQKRPIETWQGQQSRALIDSLRLSRIWSPWCPLFVCHIHSFPSWLELRAEIRRQRQQRQTICIQAG